MDKVTAPRQLRLAELVASLSLGTDLGLGQPMEHVLRTCRVSLGIADQLELPEDERTRLYWVALLAWVGCHVDSHEQSWWFGDDISARAGVYDFDMKGLGVARYAVRHVGSGSGPIGRAKRYGSLAGAGGSLAAIQATHCRIAGELASGLGLDDGVSLTLREVFARWDGNGNPKGLGGTDISLVARIVAIADLAVVYSIRGGAGAAIELLKKRSGTQFDPSLVLLIERESSNLLDGLGDSGSWQEVIELAPGADRVLLGADIDAALEAIADFTNLKSPWFAGHSRAVAELADSAARLAGLGEADVIDLRRAALVHDIGRLGISNSIWDKRGPLTHSEYERVRLYPYLTQRILADSDVLAPVGRLASRHSERLDGSGYPAGLSGDSLSQSARLLAATDVYRSMIEPRPHRDGQSVEGAAATIREEVSAGRLDSASVEAVLQAAGHRVPKRQKGPGGLTPREIEVLRLLAQGHSNREVAIALVISPKTARNHVEHIYRKIGCSTRAEASLYAMRQGLLS